ncbi:MAG: hypothetical protein ACT4P7_10370 [Gemmatimonadaceae bacterium]
MRTTVDLDPDLLERLRLEAARRRVSFKELLNAVIRGGLAVTAPRRQAPYTLPSVRMGAVREGIDLDKALRIADEIESHEVIQEVTRLK